MMEINKRLKEPAKQAPQIISSLYQKINHWRSKPKQLQFCHFDFGNLQPSKIGKDFGLKKATPPIVQPDLRPKRGKVCVDSTYHKLPEPKMTHCLLPIPLTLTKSTCKQEQLGMQTLNQKKTERKLKILKAQAGRGQGAGMRGGRDV